MSILKPRIAVKERSSIHFPHAMDDCIGSLRIGLLIGSGCLIFPILHLLLFVLKCNNSVCVRILDIMLFVYACFPLYYITRAMVSARCCECNKTITIWSWNISKILMGYLPLCVNCRMKECHDFILPAGRQTNPAVRDKGNMSADDS